MPKSDLVLEGGGAKGVGTVGAVTRLLENGFTFPRVAGTSVGALVAAVVAAGADGDRLRQVMGRLELPKVCDRFPPGWPAISESWSLLTRSGAYRGDYIRDWLYRELRDLGITTFGDLRREDSGDDENLPHERRYKLVVLATDVTDGRLLRLPWDYHLFHLDPDEQLVADAVRMSMSIPLYFEPCMLRDPVTGETSTVVDGAVLSNFAVEIFDRTDYAPARWPTLGVRLLPDLPAGLGDVFPLLGLPLLPPLDLLKRVLTTAFVGRDQTHLDQPSVRDRMITVDTTGVGITEFGLSAGERATLLERGRDAVDTFLSSWAAPAGEAAVTKLLKPESAVASAHPAGTNGVRQP